MNEFPNSAYVQQLGAQAWIEQQWDQEGRRIDSQWFGSYISLQRGIGSEQEYADWCHWVEKQLKQGQTEP